MRGDHPDCYDDTHGMGTSGTANFWIRGHRVHGVPCRHLQARERVTRQAVVARQNPPERDLLTFSRIAVILTGLMLRLVLLLFGSFRAALHSRADLVMRTWLSGSNSPS